MPPKARTEEEFAAHFWKRVDKTSDPQGCWLWTGGRSGNRSGNGYGKVWKDKKNCATHTIAYLITGHTIPIGLELAHSEHCINKKHCCNPDHLTPKTHYDNMLDLWRDNTMVKAKLTSTQVLEIRASDKTRAELSKQYKVTDTTISSIILR